MTTEPGGGGNGEVATEAGHFLLKKNGSDPCFGGCMNSVCFLFHFFLQNRWPCKFKGLLGLFFSFFCREVLKALRAAHSSQFGRILDF